VGPGPRDPGPGHPSHAPSFDRTPIRPDRVRKIDGSFAFLPHRFLRHGFWASLTRDELGLYILLLLAADRQGMSFCFDDRLASTMRVVLDDFLVARAGLVRKDLVAYDPVGPRYQVLSLPARPVIVSAAATVAPDERGAGHAAPVHDMIRDFLARMDPGPR
jgi:hypothetical protein